MFDRKLLLATTTIAGFIALAPSAGFAQTTEEETTPPAADAPPATTPSDVTEVEGLVITGSRIRRTEFTSPSPVQVITADSSTLEGLVDPAEILQTSTVASGSQQINNTFTGFVVNGGPGVNTISLRGLGDQRTLVLLNGRRLPPAGVQGQVGAVDLNILPGAMIDRYEILKDGASSIYGSDAVAGVVNVITKRDLDGGEISADASISEEGGAEEYSVSGAWGKVFDRGHFMVSAEWYKREPLLKRDRDYLDCAQPYTFDPETGERNDTIDFDTGQIKCISFTGNVVGYTPVYEAVGHTGVGGGAAFLGYTFYGSRVPIAVEGPRTIPGNPFTPEDPALTGYRFIPLDERNYNAPVEGDTTVISPADRYTVFADASYDLGFAEAYGEALLNRRESSQKGYQTIFHYVSEEAPCSVNPFNCTGSGLELLDPSAGLGAPFTHLGFMASSLFLSPIHQDVTLDVFRGLAGLRGDFSGGFLSGWNWDTYVSYSRSNGEYRTTGLYNDRVEAVTGTDVNLNFIGVCPPGSFAGCVPINFFSNDILASGTLSPAELDLLQIDETGETEYTQLIAEAQITGDLFELPAGPVGSAFGVAFRRDELDDKPGPEAVAANYWGLATAGPTKGDDTLKEAYAEFELPLVRGARFMEDLTVNLSGRYSDYDSYGSSTTYKMGVNWRLSNQVRLRATHGTSFRAPALYELYLNDQTAFLPQTSVDPCILWGQKSNQQIRANCEAVGLDPNFAGGGPSAELLIGGGDELEAEESKAYSFGFIYTPEFIDLNLAIDYWEIEVDNEVASLAASVVGQCYASLNFPNDPFCDLFVREPDGDRDISFIDASYRNITNQTSRGIDVNLRYTRDIGPGELTAEAEATWTLEDSLELFKGEIDNFNGVIGEPSVVAGTELRYDWQDWTFTWSSDFIGRQGNYKYQFGQNCDFVGNYAFAGAYPNNFSPYCGKNHAEPTWYHHASVRYEADTWSITGGVRNLFSELPPFVTDALSPDRGLSTYGRLGMTSGATQNDYVGRRFFVSVTKRF